MNVERGVRLLAGTLILVSIALTLLISPWWLLLTTFVGANLFQSSLTGFCPAERVLRHLADDSSSAFSPAECAER